MSKTIDATYPGFQRAVPAIPSADDDYADWSNLPLQIQWIRPAVKSTVNFGQGPFYGNEYFHVLEIATISNGYRAYVCDAFYKVYHPSKNANGKYSSVVDYLVPDTNAENTDWHSLQVWRVEFNEQPATTTALAPQKGSNPAPIGDVFGQWHVTGASDDNLWGKIGHLEATPDAPDYLARIKQCFDRQPYDAAQRRALYSGEHDVPPSTDPAVPGWPDNPS